MAASTSADAITGGDRADFELWVGPFEGRALKIVSFKGREAMSRLFSFDVRVLADGGDDVLEAALVGLPATLVLQVGGRAPRVVQGIVASVREEGGATRGGRCRRTG